MRRLHAVLAATALAVAGTVLPASPAPAVGEPPSLTVTPTCTDGNPALVDLDSAGLPGELPYRVVLLTGAPSPTPVLDGNTGATGAFHRTITLPSIPADHLSLLAVQVWHADGLSGTWSAILASAVVRVCPTLQANPSQVDVGALPRPVTVTGAGWYPDQPVELSVAGSPQRVVTPGKDGRFVTDVPLPVSPCGPVVVTGEQEPPTPVPSIAITLIEVPLEAATSVAVVCPPPTTPPTTTPPTTTPSPTTPPTTTPPPTTPPTTPPPDPTLTVDAVVTSGGVATAHGTGFVPGRPVLLGWRLPDGRTAPGGAAVVADAAGRFTVPCLVLPRAVLGNRALHARQVSPGGPRAAAATTLVVAGPMEPGRHRLLGRR